MHDQVVDRTAVREALIKQLKPRASKPVDGISDDTDIYGELGINGQDLWEIFDWANQTFGTDCTSITPKHYDINEPPGRWFGGKPYFRVTVGQLLDAIQRGRWIAPE